MPYLGAFTNFSFLQQQSEEESGPDDRSYMEVEELHSWADVEAVASYRKCCIAPEGANYRKAKETWEQSSKPPAKVRYFKYTLGDAVGYCRLLQVSTASHLPKTWVVDYCAPFSYAVVQGIAGQVEGSVLTKRVGTEPLPDWVSLTLGLKPLDDFPYRVQGSGEAIWLVVPKAK